MSRTIESGCRRELAIHSKGGLLSALSNGPAAGFRPYRDFE
jgi:hypothetical protein